MTDTDPYAGTTIDRDGKRVPVEEAEKQAGDSEQAVVDPPAETAESVGHATVPDAEVTGNLPNPDAERAAQDREETVRDTTGEGSGDPSDAPDAAGEGSGGDASGAVGTTGGDATGEGTAAGDTSEGA